MWFDLVQVHVIGASNTQYKENYSIKMGSMENFVRLHFSTGFTNMETLIGTTLLSGLT